MQFIGEYSSDSEDEDDDNDTNLKRKQGNLDNMNGTDLKRTKTDVEEKPKVRLPAPTGIQSMFKHDPEHLDDPTAHGGRVRTFAHERGNWASFVFAPVAPDQEEHLSDLTNTLITDLRDIADFQSCGDFHLSLSRTFVMRHHWIQPLVDTLQGKLRSSQGNTLEFGGLKCYCNEEKTRTFVSLQVGSGSSASLLSYIQTIDGVLAEYKLPKYYEEPSFHISLVWAVGDLTERLTETLVSMQPKVDEFTELLGTLDITELRLKTGNKTFCLPLCAS